MEQKSPDWDSLAERLERRRIVSGLKALEDARAAGSLDARGFIERVDLQGLL